MCYYIPHTVTYMDTAQKWYVLYVGRHSVVSEVWYTRNE